MVVLELDVDNRKLSLGHKQLSENPWNKYESEFSLDSIHNSEVTEIVPKGATVQFNEDVIAFIPSRHMIKDDGSKLQKGEVVDLKVMEFNKDTKRVVLSHTQTFRDVEEMNLCVYHIQRYWVGKTSNHFSSRRVKIGEDDFGLKTILRQR